MVEMVSFVYDTQNILHLQNGDILQRLLCVEEVIQLNGKKTSSQVFEEIKQNLETDKNINDLEKVTQTLEKIFRAASDERFAISADVLPLLVESVEVCEKLLNRKEVTCYEELLEQLNSILHV